MSVRLILRRTAKPKNPKRVIKKTLVYKSDQDGFVTVTSKKTVTDLTTVVSDEDRDS